MIATDLQIPSEENKFNISAETGKDIDTRSATFVLGYEDEGKKFEPLDATQYNYNFVVLQNNCELIRNQNVYSEDSKIWILSPHNLRKGQYDYYIEFVDGASIISGKLNIIR